MIDVNVCSFGCGKTRNGWDDPEFNGEDDLVCNDCRELERLIETMDGILPIRRNDVQWLRRNLPLNNREHPNFARVWELLERRPADSIHLDLIEKENNEYSNHDPED